MAPLHRVTKTVSRTYFKKMNPVSIEEVKPGDLVYLAVKNPHTYGNYSWDYWGKIQKVTPKFFDIVKYCDASFYGPNCCNTDTFNNAERTKRWSKQSILELCRATTIEKIEEASYYNSIPSASE